MRRDLSIFIGQCSVLLFVFAFACDQSWACDNEYHFGKDLPHGSKSIAWSQLGPVEYVKALNDRTPPSEDEFNEKRAAAEKGDFRDQTNFGVAMMRRGLHAQARDIFAKLAAEHKNEYVIAANLGTAYELTGDLPNALKWIRLGIALNGDSHEGTEWLHVKILEAKLAAQGDPKWFEQHTVLGMDFGKDAIPKMLSENIRDEKGYERSLDSVRHALEYQLHERLFYVRDPDPVVFDLLFDLGNLLSIREDYHKAAEIFRHAKRFQVQEKPLLSARQTIVEQIPVERLNAAAAREKKLVDKLAAEQFIEAHPTLAGIQQFLPQIALASVLSLVLFGVLIVSRRKNKRLVVDHKVPHE